MAELTPTLWLPRTKLFPPQVGRDVLSRPQLIERLHTAVLSHRLTLLSAPAGSGKTTAVAALHQAHPNLPLAWMTLDEDDNDPLTFLSLFVAALQTILPNCSQDLAALLASPNAANFAPRRLMGMLMNDVLEAETVPFVLVLDDLHRIETAVIYEALNYFLEHLPPSLHLVVTTRHDPPLSLSRLRSRGQLSEFRIESLHFSPAEMRALFNDLLQLNLSANDLALLQTRTEGWVAGIRLLTLSLPQTHSANERANAIHQLAQSRRFLFDYLVDEVLHQLDEADRDFLLQTSILPELTPTLCTAVSQKENTTHILADLYRRNLFLMLNETANNEPFAEPTYRYHALFAQFLQRHLQETQADLLPILHCRAAAAQADPAKAIEHYLQAQTWTEAADLIENIGREQLRSGLIRPSTIRWINQLPKNIKHSHPWLQLFLGQELSQKGLMTQASPYIDTALSIFRKQEIKEGELLSRLSHPKIYGGWAEPVAVESLLDELKAFPDLLTTYRHITHLLTLAWAYQYRLQWDKVEAHLRTAWAMMEQADSVEAYQAFTMATGPQFFFGEAGMRPIERIAQRILTRFGDGDGLVQMGAYLQLGSIHFYQANLVEAVDYAQRAQQIIKTLGGLAWLEMVVDHVRFFVWLARGNYKSMQSYWQKRLPDIERNKSYAESLSNYLYLHGLALWYQGKYDEIRAIMPKIEANQTQWDAGQPRVMHMMAGWLALGDGRYHEAESHLQKAIPLQTKTRHTALCSHARLNLAAVYWFWCQATHDEVRLGQALAELDIFLAEVSRRQMPGMGLQTGRIVIPLLQQAAKTSPYSQLIQQILAAFGEDEVIRPLAIPTTNETLTPREVEVLRLLISGASNKEIAAQLTITSRTAKAHVSNILQKLQVRSRTEAVAKAHELALF